MPHAYGILVPQPSVEPMSPAVEVLSLNHCITREVLEIVFAFGKLFSPLFLALCVCVRVCVCVCVCVVVRAHSHGFSGAE